MGVDSIRLHTFHANPTKNAIKDNIDDFLTELRAWLAKQTDVPTICLLLNKDSDLQALHDFRDELKAAGYTVVVLPRGQIIGSNEGKDAGHIYIVTSIFTHLADYCLRLWPQ